MQRTIPDYLKLHVEAEPDAQQHILPAFPGQEALLASFEKLTGWTLRYQADRPADNRGIAQEPAYPRPQSGQLSIDDMSADLPAGKNALHRGQCEELVQALNNMLTDLNKTRLELWKREAELATGVPVITHGQETPHLASRLESVLEGVIQAVSADAAALYVLDDATTQLKLRAASGLPSDRFLEPSRPLRGAMADLEALVGHAVVLEDTSLLPHWKAPEDYAAAVCVPVSSATMPLGTLWVFANQVRDFNATETNLVEIVAGRLAAELEREAALQQSVDATRNEKEISLASTWQQDRLPNVKPILDDWEVAGWTKQNGSVGGDFHDWNVLPNGQLAIAVSDAQGAMLESALTAATIHACIRSHGNYDHQSRQMMAYVNETLWTSGVGDQFASLFYALIHPETGTLQYSLSGTMGSVLLGKSRKKVLSEEYTSLGSEPEPYYQQVELKLKSGDILIVFSEGVRHTLTSSGSQSCDQEILQHLQQAPVGSAQEAIDSIRQWIQASGDPFQFDMTVLALARR